VVALLALWFSTSNYHSVVPRQLYRSAQLNSDHVATAAARDGIETVINLRGRNRDKDWYDDQREALRNLRLAHYDIAVSAHELPDITELKKLTRALQTARRPILVHCRDGADRSGLASALFLLLDGKHTLADAWRQTSPLYRALRSDSVGKQFLRKYEAWLEASGRTHTPERLLAWIELDYEDGKGNLRFIVDNVNGQDVTRDHRDFEVRGNALHVQGWAFDLRLPGLLKQVTLLLGEKALPETRYGKQRNDVAETFNLPAVTASGWEARADLAGWPRTCYDARLRMSRLDGSEWTSERIARICLE
jgi:protein tyrosine phosphatase (PTP) superfamily phosphohydrolase (DUF442 family)